MCGITGIIHYCNIQDAPDRVRPMTHALAHRGPDAEGFYNDPLVSFGHRRLSIIDLSTSANQPFTDPSGRYVLVFNGEIYNYLSLKEELKDYPFNTTSDTEVLMAAFIKWGIDCVQKLKGMFAFSLWDKQEETCWLVRDRLGVKPLVYADHNGSIIFSSERRSIIASGCIKKELDHQAMFEFLSYQSTGYPDTMLKGITQLKAGSYLKKTRHSVETIQYWHPATIQPQQPQSIEVIRKEIFDRMQHSIANRMMSDVPMGAFLSGGIDSSAVVAMMSLHANSKVNTFNISFTEKDYDESKYAELISKRFATNHEKVLLQPDDFIAEVENALNAIDSPTMDGVNTFVLSKAIRQTGIKVAMSGIGGDELFAGYPSFMQYYRLRKQSGGYAALWPFRKVASELLKYSSSNKRRRLSALLSLNSTDIQHVYPILRSVLTSSLINQFTNLRADHSMLSWILEDDMRDADRLGIFSQYSIAEYLGYTQNTLLKDADQMSMAVGLEIREPFFDHELVEYVLSLPDHVKFPIYPKQLMVESLRPLLPDDIVHRKKQGFLLPWEKWMRRELKSFCEKQIESICKRDIINAPALKTYWNRFLKNDPSVRWSELWLFVVLGYWMDRNGVE